VSTGQKEKVLELYPDPNPKRKLGSVHGPKTKVLEPKSKVLLIFFLAFDTS
jgi:hypothetical protein